MDLNQYIRLFRKWAWLIVLAAVVGGGIAYYVRRGQPETYKAVTKILVGSYRKETNPDPTDIGVGSDLAKTYAELAKTRAVMQGTIDTLGLDTDARNLVGALQTKILEETSILELTIIYSDPDLAAAIANEIANQLIATSPTNLSPQELEQLESARNQIPVLNAQIESANARLAILDQQILQATDQEQLLLLQAQYSSTLNTVEQASAAVANMQTTISNLQLRTNSLDIVDEAVPAQFPEDKGVLRTAILGAIIGVILSSGLVLFINYQESTVKSVEQVTSVLDLPVLGTVTRFGRSKDTYPQRLITHISPTSPVSEIYNTLHTNMLVSADGATTRQGVYVITSPNPGEGKSVTAANLAVSIAMSGARVLLIDADLRQPKVHEILELENRGNLSQLLTQSPADLGIAPVPPNGHNELPEALQDVIQSTDIPNLFVITSGPLPEIPAEVLHSVELSDWIKIFKLYLNVDVILFDTPPCLVVADSAILSANVHAEVVLVVEAGQTQRVAARKARDQFAHIGSPISGVVLNKVNPREQVYGHGYGYGYYTSPKGQLNGKN